MSWSAPCDAIERNAPPMSPAHRVCGLSKASVKSKMRSFPLALASEKIPPQPFGAACPIRMMAAIAAIKYTIVAENYEEVDAEEKLFRRVR